MQKIFLIIWFVASAGKLMPQNIIQAEYFIDTDPGPGNAINISGIPLEDTLIFPLTISSTGLIPGFHIIGIRVKDEQNKWSHFGQRTFYVNLPASSMPSLVAAEYFINNDPGIANGDPVTVSALDTIATILNLNIPETNTIGQYYLGLRTKDASGRWSHFRYDTLTVALSVPSDTVVTASQGLCSRIVNMIDAMTINNEAYTYSLTGATVGSGSGSASGTSFNVGITTVTYALVSNPGVDDEFTVTVLDDQLPLVTCPDNITQGTDDTICGVIINYVVNFNDNCPDAELTLLSGLNSGSVFPLGTTTNTFRVIDASGNSSTCSFTVTISDDVPPSIDCPPDVTVGTDPGECLATSVSLGIPGIYDNCGISSSGNDALIEYPLGNTTVTWSVTDVHGLTASCIQAVTIIDDEAPVITCPPDITAFAEPGSQPVIVNYEPPEVSDNCPGVMTSQTAGLPSGSLFPIGVTTNTFVSTDGNGNMASCSFTVTVKVGRVGINTTSPLAMLHVVDSSVVFTGPDSLPEHPGNAPVNGYGARMMWYPDKAVFRAGITNTGSWDQAYTGKYSFATNFSTKADGLASAAFNYLGQAGGDYACSIRSIAYGDFSFATGYNSSAIGEASVAMGYAAYAGGEYTAAFGFSTQALGFASFAAQDDNLALGNYASALGSRTRAFSDHSVTFGNRTSARAYASFGLGRFNDSTALSTTDWELLDPLFFIGNGADLANRANALTVLKNGNMGLFERNPSFRLHVSGDNAQAGGAFEGILIENINATPGEAAISFRNKSLQSTQQWMIGLDQNPNLSFVYGSSLVPANTKMSIDTTGNLGINSQTPQTKIHIVRGNSPGGDFDTNLISIFESQFSSFLHYSNDNDDSGILSGNETTTQRSGIIFTQDSAVQLRAGSIVTRMRVNKDGNIGINTGNPSTKLHVSGTTKLGNTGTPFNGIVKSTIVIDVPTVLPNETTVVTISAEGVQLGGALIISPGSSLPSGLIIASSRVSSVGMVEIKFTNKSMVSVDPSSMNYYIAQIH